MNSGVYIIENNVNGKVYVGSAADLSKRWSTHQSQLADRTHKNPPLQRAWIKYGAASFKFKALLYCGKKFLRLWEQIAIDGFSSFLGWDNMYNICPIAGSRGGVPTSEEHRNKISQALTGYKHSPEFCEKQRIDKLGNTFGSGKRSQEFCQKVGQSLIGNKNSLGIKHSAEARSNMSDAALNRKGVNPLIGRKLPEEHKRKISEALKKRRARGA